MKKNKTLRFFVALLIVLVFLAGLVVGGYFILDKTVVPRYFGMYGIHNMGELVQMMGTLYNSNNETDIVITKDIFDGDALILSGMKSDTVYLESDLRPQKIKFNFGKAPVLGIWAKPGAEYVCIEPWYGINDSREVKDDFSQKRLIQKLEPGEEFVFPWSAEIIE